MIAHQGNRQLYTRTALASECIENRPGWIHIHYDSIVL